MLSKSIQVAYRHPFYS